MTAANYRFDPNIVSVKKGDRVKLVITATDRDHGIKLAAFHTDQKLPKGETVRRIHCRSSWNIPISMFGLLWIGPQENEGPADRRVVYRQGVHDQPRQRALAQWWRASIATNLGWGKWCQSNNTILDLLVGEPYLSTPRVVNNGAMGGATVVPVLAAQQGISQCGRQELQSDSPFQSSVGGHRRSCR
jgi:hypothetical protein